MIFDAADLATPDEQAAIDVFNGRLNAKGHWVFAGGLGAPSMATAPPMHSATYCGDGAPAGAAT